MELTRAKFEEMVSHLVESTIEPMTLALKDCDLKPADIDRIVLVGVRPEYLLSKMRCSNF
jgi:molecular chaperone DnaK